MEEEENEKKGIGRWISMKSDRIEKELERKK